MARAQVNTNLGSPELTQTVAHARGISAPAATVQPSGLMSLAQSLTDLRPEITNLIGFAQDDFKEKEEARAYDTIQGMTYEKSKAAVDAGEMRKTESPWFRAAFQKQFGMVHASERRREILTAYNTSFDKSGGDINEFLSKYAQDDYEKYQGSEFIRAGIREGMQGVFDQVRNTQAEYTNNQLQTSAVEQFSTIAGDSIAKSVEAGGDPNAAISSIVSQHMQAGLLDQDSADKALMGLATQYAADGNVTALNALLTSDPTGRGSFMTRSGFSVEATGLLENGKAKAAEEGRKASIQPRAELELRAGAGQLDDTDTQQIDSWVESGLLTPDAAEGLIVRNRSAKTGALNDAAEVGIRSTLLDNATKLVIRQQGAAIQDTSITLPDGTSKKVTGKELRESVINEQMSVLLDDKGGSTAKAAQHLSSWGLPENFQPWEDQLTNGLLSLTPALTQPDADGKINMPDNAKQAYGLYRELSGTPELRNRHIKNSNAANIYRDAEILEKVGGKSPEEALTMSARIDRGSSRTGIATSINRDAFEAAVGTVMSGSKWFGDAPVNGQIVRTAVEEHARILMDMGIPQDKAIGEAITSFQSSYTDVGGVFVNTRDRYVPQNLAAISDAIVLDYQKTHPDAEQTYLTPDRTQDYWVLCDEYGAPVEGAVSYHVTDLPAFLSNRNMEAANAEIRKKSK